jgi:hypothetical protein
MHWSIDGNRTYVLNHKIEDMNSETTTFSIYSLIKQAYPTFEFDVSTTRVYFNKQPCLHNNYKIASFFYLNPFDGQLTLKKQLKQQILSQDALKMKQDLHLVFLSESHGFVKPNITFSLDIDLSGGRKLFDKATFAINFEDLLEKSSKSLYKFGRISENITKTKKYYLETTKMIVTETKTYDLILANTINLSNSYNSIIYLDIKSGDLYLNRTHFFELNLVEYNFVILEYNDVDSRLLSRIETKLILKFNHYANFINYFVNFRRNPIIIDRFIDMETVKLGDHVFKMSDLFSNFFEFDPYHQMQIELDTDFSQTDRNNTIEQIPFKLDPTNGALIIADNLEANTVYKFSLNLIDTFSVYFRFRTSKENILFEQHAYEINLNETVFNSIDSTLFKLNANYSTKNKTSRIIYRFYDSSLNNTNNYNLVGLFKSMLTLNELSGEVQINSSQKHKFTSFCNSFESIDISDLFLTVKAFSQVKNKSINFFYHPNKLTIFYFKIEV